MMFGSVSLIPLKKPDGGVRPVAVGDTLWRFVAKVIAARPATKVVISALRPLQCGVSVPGACEAVGMGVAEAVRQLRMAPPVRPSGVLQIDLTNTFNSIDRQGMLDQVAARAPTSSHGPGVAMGRTQACSVSRRSS